MQNNRRSTIISATIAATCCCGMMASATLAQGTMRADREQPQAERQAGQDRDREDTERELERLASLEGTWDVDITIHRSLLEKHDVRSSADRQQETVKFKGKSTRKWRISDTVLEETFSIDVLSAGNETDADRDENQRRERRQTGDQADRQQNRDQDRALQQFAADFEGLGLFSYDKDREEFALIWADTLKHGLGVTYGEFDTSDQTFSFTRDTDARKKYPAPGPGARRPEPARERGQERNREADPSAYRSRTTGMADNPVISIEVVSENEHIVRMMVPDARGEQREEYKLVYTRSNER